MELIPSFLGEARDDGALPVEQGEICYTYGRIGTGSVYDCLCVAVRDSDTGKVALVHVDSSNHAASMKRIFDRLPECYPPQASYQVHLVGAGFDASLPKEQRNPDVEENIGFSAQNLKTVIKALRGKHVDIISADIPDRSQPKSLVVNAEDFSMAAIKPAQNDQQPSWHGKAFLGCLGKKENSINNTIPLRIAFDASYSPHNAPLFLSGAEAGKLRELFHG